MGGIRDLHAGQRAHETLVFENGLQRALRYFWLVGGVCSVEFAALQDVVDGGRNIVVVRPRAEEGNQVRAQVFITAGDLAKFGGDFHFGQCRRQVQLGKAMFGRDILKQILQAFHTNGVQHRIPLSWGVGNVGHEDSLSVIAMKR